MARFYFRGLAYLSRQGEIAVYRLWRTYFGATAMEAWERVKELRREQQDLEA